MSRQTYIRYDRNGQTSERLLMPDNMKLVRRDGVNMLMVRTRYGKTAKDHRNGNPQRAYQRKRARDAWRSQTASTVYTDSSLVPKFPN